MRERLSPWLIYPATMAGCLALHFALRAQAVPLPWSMYLPAIAGAALVTLGSLSAARSRTMWLS